MPIRRIQTLFTKGLTIFSGRANPSFASIICSQVGVEAGRCEVIRFSDGELSVEIGDNVRGRDVFVVQSTSAPGNDHLMELLIIIDALKRASAGRVTAVVPYFGYARQDRKLKPRVPITAKLVTNLITTAGADRVLTMDLHAGQIMGFFDIPVDNLLAMPVLVDHLKKNYEGEEITVVSPDMGGMERARILATKMDNADLAVIDKRRVRANEIAEMKVVGEVQGKTCIIVDDMVDTGGTLMKAANTLLTKGASKVIAACTHAVFSGNAVTRLNESAFSEIVISDTIRQPTVPAGGKITVLSVAPLFAEAIKRIHSEDSISTLFK